MRLYKVRMSIEVVVWAADEAQALAVARTEGQRDMRLADATDPRPVIGPEDIPAKWDTGSIPWGRADDVTIGELIGRDS